MKQRRKIKEKKAITNIGVVGLEVKERMGDTRTESEQTAKDATGLSNTDKPSRKYLTSRKILCLSMKCLIFIS